MIRLLIDYVAYFSIFFNREQVLISGNPLFSVLNRLDLNAKPLVIFTKSLNGLTL